MRNVSLLLLALCACDRNPARPAERPPPLPVVEGRRPSPFPAREGLTGHLTVKPHLEGVTEPLALAEIKKRVIAFRVCLAQNIAKFDDATHNVRLELSPEAPRVTVRSDWAGAEPALPCLHATAERVLQSMPLSRRAEVGLEYRIFYRDSRLE